MLSRLHLSPRISRAATAIAAALVCAFGTYTLAKTLEGSYPVKEWLVWDLLPIWGYTLLFNASCVAFGSFALRHLLGQRELPAIERLLQSMMLGLVSFVLGLYVLGFVGLFKPWASLGLVGVMLSFGIADARALWMELRGWRRSVSPRSETERVLGSLAIIGGAAALVFLYLEALNTSAINFDATWYHFPIAQDYARVGRIIPFPSENHRAFPHLTSLVHTWALLVPGLRFLPQHWMLSLHLEFTIVVWRLVGAYAIARWLLGGRDVRGLWACFFLFPSVFVYDQAIGGSADHFLGFFAAPTLLAAGRALKTFDRRWCVLCGAALGGHMLVKYQAVYLFAGLTLATLASMAVLAARRLYCSLTGHKADALPTYRALLVGASMLALTAALVSAPHFAKNAVFYHNPVYPFAKSVFKSTFPKPTPGYYVEKPKPGGGAFPPKYSGLQRQLWAAGKVFTYPLATANRKLTDHRPYMGALFSMLLPCVLFVPRRKRLLFTAGIITVAMMVWANSAANDRYLLSFYDLCIGSALALMVYVWDLGLLARLGLVPLVALQLFWGGDAMLFYGRKQLNAAIELIVDGYSGDYGSTRLAAKSLQQQITRATPQNAVILSRNYKGLLGLNRLVLSDIPANQDYIVYSHVRDPREFYDQLKARGVTHLLYPRGERRPGTWGNEILFAELFRRGSHTQRFGKLQLTELSKTPPPASAPYLVLVAGLREYPEGIYKLEQLDIDYRSSYETSPVPLRRVDRAQPAEAQLNDVQAVALCRGRLPKGWSRDVLKDFESVETVDGCENYLRRLP